MLCIAYRVKVGLRLYDDGDPLVSRGQLVGVAAYYDNGDNRVPDVYTRISSVAGWIQSVSGVEAV